MYLCIVIKKVKMMKIPKQLIVDYACVCIAFMVLIIAMHPVYFGEFQVTQELIVMLTQECILAYFLVIVAEIFVTYVLRKPFSYSDEYNVRFHHFLLCSLVTIPLYTAMLNQFLVIKKFGWEHWEYAWIDFDGLFSLKWFLNRLLPCIVSSVIMILIAMPIISQIRVMLISIRELKEINQLLETEQTKQHNNHAENKKAEKIILHGDSRETLIVNPYDIMYAESVGNYLSIVYFNESFSESDKPVTELCTKRLRSSLKDVEEALETFPFLVHIHRAFLVNINFITQVSGNSAGYKVSMFSTDKVLPVSKANVATFRDKIKELGKDLG